MIQYDCMPKAAGGAQWVITAQKKNQEILIN